MAAKDVMIMPKVGPNQPHVGTQHDRRRFLRGGRLRC